MKVLQINSVYDFGSTGKITADIHRLLPQYGIESVVCYGRRDKSHEANVYQICNDFYSHIEHFRANVTGVMYGGCELSTYRLKKIIEKEKPDVVHLQCLNNYFVNIYKLVEWLKKKHIPTILTLHAEFKVTLGEIVDLLQEFKAQPTTLMMPKMPDGSFAKKLYSLYLTYLPTDKFKYALKMNMDNRGSFTELVHTADCGQVSINISRPGITKGQHWHNSKWELFIVVAGHGLIQERNINTGETVEFEVSGDKIEAVHMIPGWTHNIINLSETENLVTVMTCNEIFNPNHPDTFFEPV